MTSIEAQIRDAERRLFAHYDVSATEHLLDLKVEGAPLRVRVLEAGSGSPVVLLHPASWYGAHWAPLIPHLPGRRLLCVDFPGHGLSDGVDYREHDPRRHTVAMLRELWTALGLEAVPVLGSSLGGMSALWLAVAEPRLVSNLVVLGVPAIALPGGGLDLVLRLMTIPGLNRFLMALPSNPQRSRQLSKGAFGPEALARTPREAFEIHHLAGTRPEFGITLTTLLQTATQWFSPLPQYVLTDVELAGLHPPVSFIWGTRDIYGGPELAERAAGLIPSATTTVHHGGHFPQLDDPASCGKRITDFLNTEPAAS